MHGDRIYRWPSLPPTRIFTAFQAFFGVCFMLWICFARWEDHDAFANAIMSLTVSCAEHRTFLVKEAAVGTDVRRMCKSRSRRKIADSRASLEK